MKIFNGTKRFVSVLYLFEAILQGRIQNPVKHLIWRFKSLTIFVASSDFCVCVILDISSNEFNIRIGIIIVIIATIIALMHLLLTDRLYSLWFLKDVPVLIKAWHVVVHLYHYTCYHYLLSLLLLILHEVWLFCCITITCK